MSMADVLSCFEERIVPGLPGLKTAQPDAPDFLGRIKGALLRALQQVDDLPRDHPVWRYLAVQTVNPHRLEDYSRRRLRENPLDKDALWSLIALGLGGGSGFSREHWQHLLVAEESFNPDWLIFAGLFEALSDGWGVSFEGLTRFLAQNGLCERVIPVLNSLESGENEYARVALDEFYVHDPVMDWARKVRERCEEARK